MALYAGVLGMAGFATLALILWFATPDGHRHEGLQTSLALYILIYVVSTMCHSVGRGFNVLAQERVNRRFELLQCSPLTTGQMVSGLFLAAWRPVAEQVVGFGTVLLCAPPLAEFLAP